MCRSWRSRLRSRRTVANDTPNRSAISSTLSEPDSDRLQQLQNLLPAPRPAHIPAPRHQIGRGFAHVFRAAAVHLGGVIMFAHKR